MTIRERTEVREKKTLSVYAKASCDSAGRARFEQPCEYRTCYQRDRDRIIHSKAFRRLKDKTQVFLAPEGDHYRTRLTHTLEVAQIARTIARALELNEDLTEAAALGHDLGHTPFGHAGERALNELAPGGFSHNGQSLRVVDRLENDGAGLNLTVEVRDGILCHTGDKRADTLEGRIIHFADRIAYINHDIDDAVRADILRQDAIPHEITDQLGRTKSERIDALVTDIIMTSMDQPDIMQSDAKRAAMEMLRDFMFETVYKNPVAKGEEGKVVEMISKLYEYYVERPDSLPPDVMTNVLSEGVEPAVCDYIAGMTDRFCVAKYVELFVPQGWQRI